jgi:glucan phosphoethanolaminetransferase (alkaline phosphatase superfamily)
MDKFKFIVSVFFGYIFPISLFILVIIALIATKNYKEIIKMLIILGLFFSVIFSQIHLTDRAFKKEEEKLKKEKVGKLEINGRPMNGSYTEYSEYYRNSLNEYLESKEKEAQSGS